MTRSSEDRTDTPAHTVTIVKPSASLKRMSDLITVALSLSIVLGLLWLLSDVVLLLFAAVLLACQLAGAARRVATWTRLPYGAALATVIVVLAVAIGLYAWLFGPNLVREIGSISGQVNAQVATLWQRLGDVEWLQGTIDKARSYVEHLGSHVAGYAAGFVTSTLGGFGSVLLILVAAIYLAASPDLYVDGLIALMPRRWRDHAGTVMAEEGHTLRWWFIGQLIDMAAIGILTGIGLAILGVKLALTLALIAALFNFVPYIGTLAGSVPAILVGLAQSPIMALYVTILFVVVQTLEGNLIAPLIQKRTVALPPLLTLMSQTVLGTLFGPMGLILATPVTASGLVLVRRVYREKILGDPPDGGGTSA